MAKTSSGLLAVTPGATIDAAVDVAPRDGSWYDDETELRFRFTWRRLQPFGTAVTRDNLKERRALLRRRKRAQIEEIVDGQRQQHQQHQRLHEAVKALSQVVSGEATNAGS